MSSRGRLCSLTRNGFGSDLCRTFSSGEGKLLYSNVWPYDIIVRNASLLERSPSGRSCRARPLGARRGTPGALPGQIERARAVIERRCMNIDAVSHNQQSRNQQSHNQFHTQQKYISKSIIADKSKSIIADKSKAEGPIKHSLTCSCDSHVRDVCTCINFG